MNFSALKKSRGKGFDKLRENTAQALSGKQENRSDDRFWSPTVDKAGNGYAVLRFLPSKDCDIPYVQQWSHGFKGPTGQWYIELSRTTLGEEDPVAEYNSKLWNSGEEDEARKQKRRLHYIANVLVVKDQGNPDNEGKVFLYKFGKKIFEKLNAAMNPEFEDEEAMNPFDMWEGAPFRLKIRKVEGYRNYDKSDFGEPEPIFEDDDELEALYNKTYNVEELNDPKNFKSYDELKARMERVLGLGVSRKVEEDESPFKDDDEVEEAPKQKSKPPTKTKAKKAPAEPSDDEDEDIDALMAELEGADD